MAFNPIEGFQTQLTAFLSNVSTLMSLPAPMIAKIQAELPPGDFTVFAINAGTKFEYVQCTGVSGGQAVITRGTEGTTAQAWAAGSTVRFLWTSVGILGLTNGGLGVPINLTGSNAANVTGGPINYNVDVPFVSLAAGSGIAIGGAFPNFTVTNTDPGGVVSPTIVTGTGVVNVTPIMGGYNVNVPTTTIVAGAGIAIGGAFPNFTVTNTNPPGGTGTVTSVTSGTGITVTGIPSVTPIVSITNTGVAPGVYGGITVNAQGQITAISASLITSIVSGTPSFVVSGPIAGVVTLTQNSATTASEGIVQLAVPTNAGSNNPLDSTSAVTPAGVAAVLAAYTASQTQTTLFGTGNLVPLPPASYPNQIAGISYPLSIQAGQIALITAYVEVYDTVTPTNVSNFAIALFNGLTLIDGNSVLPGNTRTIYRQITGPFTGVINLNHTNLAATEVLGSYYLNVIYK